MDDSTLMEHIREAIKQSVDPLHSQLGKIDSMLRGSYSNDEPGMIDVLRDYGMRLRAVEVTIEQPKKWGKWLVGTSLTGIIGVACTGMLNSCELKRVVSEQVAREGAKP